MWDKGVREAEVTEGAEEINEGERGGGASRIGLTFREEGEKSDVWRGGRTHC